MAEIQKILFVEDVQSDAELIWREMEKTGLVFTRLLVDNRFDYLEGLRQFDPDLIISDYSLPQFDGMAALLLRNELAPDKPFILVTGSVNEETAVECMKAGADDYILKNNLARLGPAVTHACERIKLLTDKRKAEEELRKANVRHSNVVKLAPAGIGIVKNRIIIEVNRYICELTGYAAHELIGSNSRMLYPSDQEFEYVGFEKYRQIEESGIGRVESRWRRKDGTLLHVLLTSSYINATDQIDGALFTVLDITELKRAEEAILAERRMLRTLIDHLPAMVYIKDSQGRKVISNLADIRNIGLETEEEVIGKTDLELFPGSIGDRGYEDDQKVLGSAEMILDKEEEFIDPDGTRRMFLTTKIPIKDNDGQVTGLVGIGHDITERKYFESELIKARDKAEEGDRLKTAFLHNISHEIRTPMNAIVGFSNLLGEDDLDESDRQSYIRIILDSSNHLLSVISDIVDISNIEANLVKINRDNVDINSAIKIICGQFMPLATGKQIGLAFETDIPHHLARVVTDSGKLTQILLCLITNSIRFTEKGYVKVGCKIVKGFIDFHVIDTGYGIPDEYQSRVFDRFYQVPQPASRLNKGTGLGLAIVKANVELLGGRIWLKSESGVGTTFFFTIPYEQQAVQTPAPEGKDSPAVFSFPLAKTILVAEDIDSNYQLICSYLSKTNSILIRAFNGKDAVDKYLSNKSIDLILMDMRMPVMDGFEAVRLIRKNNPSIPIIAQTAYIDDREKLFACGCNGFLPKPFDRRSLLNSIREYL